MDREDADQTLRYSHLGIQFVLVIGVFCYAGYWLDGKLESTPLFLFVGSVVGFSVGFYQLYQEVFGDPRPPGRNAPRQSGEEQDEGREP